MKNGLKFDGDKLKMQRESRGLSFEKFAERLRRYSEKASKSSCWQWEQGTEPSSKYLMAISKVLKKSPSYFYSKR